MYPAEDWYAAGRNGANVGMVLNVSTIFTKIINGEIPGRFVWSDDKCVAFLDVFPMTDGHALVVPREEVDQWVDADDDLHEHLFRVVKTVGTAQRAAFECERIGVMIVGYEVRHEHIHVYPTTSMKDFDLSIKDMDPDPAKLDANAEALRAALRNAGHGEFVPEP